MYLIRFIIYSIVSYLSYQMINDWVVIIILFILFGLIELNIPKKEKIKQNVKTQHMIQQKEIELNKRLEINKEKRKEKNKKIIQYINEQQKEPDIERYNRSQKIKERKRRERVNIEEKINKIKKEEIINNKLILQNKKEIEKEILIKQLINEQKIKLEKNKIRDKEEEIIAESIFEQKEIKKKRKPNKKSKEKNNKKTTHAPVTELDTASMMDFLDNTYFSIDDSNNIEDSLIVNTSEELDPFNPIESITTENIPKNKSPQDDEGIQIQNQNKSPSKNTQPKQPVSFGTTAFDKKKENTNFSEEDIERMSKSERKLIQGIIPPKEIGNQSFILTQWEKYSKREFEQQDKQVINLEILIHSPIKPSEVTNKGKIGKIEFAIHYLDKKENRQKTKREQMPLYYLSPNEYHEYSKIYGKKERKKYISNWIKQHS